MVSRVDSILSEVQELSRKKFSKRSNEFGLTYADAGRTVKEMMFEVLRLTDIAGVKPDMVMLCEEIGENTGRRHYHSYVHYPKKVTIHEDSFDFFDLHCHIDKVKRTRNRRSIIPMIKYLTKSDPAPLSTFDWRQMLEEEQGSSSRKVEWEVYINEDLTQDEVFNRLISDGFANELANHYFNWAGFIKKTFREKDKTPYQPNLDFRWNLPENLSMWSYTFMGWIDGVLKMKRTPWHRPNSLVLIGPSRTGKTEWARHFGPHMYFNTMLNLDDWDEDADYIVLDDFNSDINKFLPAWKCFFGGQKEFTLTDKYRGKKTVHWGKPMIWLSNEDIFKHLNIEQADFIKKNCTVICLTNKLY